MVPNSETVESTFCNLWFSPKMERDGERMWISFRNRSFKKRAKEPKEPKGLVTND